MANPICAPTLSPQGWVTDVNNKADVLLSWFYESMHSQSYVYGNKVSSLQYLLQKYGNNITIFIQKLQDALELYLGRYYDVATATVTSDSTDITNLGTTSIVRIHCSVMEGGITYSMGGLLTVANSKITSISKLINR